MAAAPTTAEAVDTPVIIPRGPAAVCALEDEIDPGAFHPDVHRRVKDAPVDHPDGIAFRRTFGRRGRWWLGHARIGRGLGP